MARSASTPFRTPLVALAMAVLAFPVSAAHAATREYWIVAEETEWDYAPSFPTNLLSGTPFSATAAVTALNPICSGT